ncbi:hypothetical protein [Draconibacterium sp.]|uniref:hypothetical protein n=1 Tax=Draconibacterium sp. TaxID=1965318 RepID=UPI0035653601
MNIILDCAFDLFPHLRRVSPAVTHILSLRDMALKAANENNPVRSAGIKRLKGNRPAK